MIQYHLDANVQNLQSMLMEMAAISENILEAGAVGDEFKVRLGVDRMRQLNSDVQVVEEKYKTYFDTRPENEKLKISKILDQYKKSEEFCKVWTQRYKNIAPIKVLLELPDGPGGILDMALPAAWDWKTDVIAFSDQSDARLVQQTISRGQVRTLVFCNNPIDEINRINGALYFDDPNKIEEYFPSLYPRLPKRICIFDTVIEPICVLGEEEIEERKKFIDKTKKAYDALIMNKNTIGLLGESWITQGVENLPFIAKQPSFRHLAEKISNVPVVIISPGPSLDKNIRQLKDIKSQALLIAPAQTAMALHKENIYPDIIMIADPNDFLYVLDGFDMSKVSALLVGVCCHPELYKRYHNKIISFNVNGPLDAWVSNIFDDHGYRGAGGSVSSMAFLLAKVLNCNPIILVGQDLSFSGERQYSEGCADGDVAVEFEKNNNTFKYTKANPGFDEVMRKMAGENYQGRAVTLPGYYGGTVLSKPDYAMFHSEFERMARQNFESNSPSRLLNCTEGGAYINGFEHIPLLQAIKEIDMSDFPLLNKEQIFADIFQSVDKKTRFEKLNTVLNEIDSALRCSITLAKECHALAVAVERGKLDASDLSIKEKYLIKEIKTSNFISIAMQHEIQSAVRLSESAKSLKENLGASKLLYKLVLRESKKILPFVKKSTKTFKILSDEMKIHSLPRS